MFAVSINLCFEFYVRYCVRQEDRSKRTHDISLFRFPYNDLPRFVQWLKLTAEEVKSTGRVCSDHFLPDSYETLQVKCPDFQPIKPKRTKGD